ncbi:MAG: hypothetical protein HY812_10095 [Planctomycetes bacterium]|nr:hypothetical protein [Planctomycetota bacterium]
MTNAIDLDAGELLWPASEISVWAHGLPLPDGKLLLTEEPGGSQDELAVTVAYGRAQLPPLPRTTLWVRREGHAGSVVLDPSVWLTNVLYLP